MWSPQHVRTSTLDRSPVHHRATQRQAIIHTFRIVKKIHSYPYLHDVSLPLHSDKYACQNSWQEISASLETSVHGGRCWRNGVGAPYTGKYANNDAHHGAASVNVWLKKKHIPGLSLAPWFLLTVISSRSSAPLINHLLSHRFRNQ